MAGAGRAALTPPPLPARIFSYDIHMACVRALALVAAVVLALPAPAFAQKVTRVTSGDTVEVAGVGKVQLLGIRSADQPAVSVGQGTIPPPQPRSGPDTPPTPAVSGALKLRRERPSRDYLRQLVLGKNVRVQFDPLVGDNAGHRAYLFLDDGTLVNAEMLRAGRARVDLSREFAHQAEFKELEDEAKHKGLGIWISAPR
jgi:endonuclease YncB( thermonuclease family)